jgi:hypothetical protein
VRRKEHWTRGVNTARVTYRPRLDATPDTELNALSACYAFILQKHQERQKAAHPGGPDDPERRSNEIRAKVSIP